MICKQCNYNKPIVSNNLSTRNMYNKNDKYIILRFSKNRSIKNLYHYGTLTRTILKSYKVKATKDLKNIVYTCPNCNVEMVIKSVIPDYNANRTELQNVKAWLELGWVVNDVDKKLVI